ncbi:uncharacterized protein LOC124414903 [Diprion similis]|uniref:uncharacterized protein LOC124414903 n=1 Tax=Diprion similis TaxID=362088 RepID=UPI001EF91DC4|nr:uncharacterized protein LOC124414903 [Diprion similis]
MVKLMDDHLKPKLSEVMERCIFNQARQQVNEKVADFATRLKTLSLNCNFTDLKIALRDQFVCGIRDEDIRITLFKMEKLDYDSALKEAIAKESPVVNATASMNALEGKQQSEQSSSNERKSKSEPGRSKQNTECYWCGKANHVRTECYFRNAECRRCKGRGHLERVCKKKKAALNKIEEDDDDDDDSEAKTSQYSTHREDFYQLETSQRKHECLHISGNGIKANVEPMYIGVGVNGKEINMEIDSGTYVTVISEYEKNKQFEDLNITKTSVKLRTYDNKELKPISKLTNLAVEFNNVKCTVDCFVMPGNGLILIGQQWLAALDKYKELFSVEPGLYNKSKIKIYLKEGARAVASKYRHIPEALKPLVEREMKRLVGLKHLNKVESSEWATPLVPTFKSNGNIRLCGDFKLTLNPWIIIDKYSLHMIQEIFLVLQGGESYSELDVYDCYMQFEPDEESAKLLTVVTHLGLYQYTKLPEGVSTAPADVQKKMDECLRGLKGVISYIDNIYVTGRTKEEHVKNLKAVCEQLVENGSRLNKDKCKLMQEKIEVLGFVIDKNRLHKAESKVDAMIKAPRPKNSKELLSILGSIDFYAQFLKNRSYNLRPLYECANAKGFLWTENCEKAFEWVKD